MSMWSTGSSESVVFFSPIMVHLYTARMRPMRKRLRMRLLSDFVIQIEHKREHGKTSTARLLLA